MNTDIRISTDFLDNPKTVKLERRLGIQGIKSLLALWIWAAKKHPNGRLEGEDVEAIEIAAKWPVNDSLTNVERTLNDSLTIPERKSTNDQRKSTLVETLVSLHWLDLCDGTFCLHDWREHNGRD